MLWEIDSLEQLKEPIIWLKEAVKTTKIVLLKGDLGAGKTTLASAFVKQMGVHEEPNSPTFSIINEYTFTNTQGEEKTIFHIDLYRINSLEEALNIGIEDYLFSDSICLIEWPDIIQDILPENYISVDIESTGPTSRKIRIFNFEKPTI